MIFLLNWKFSTVWIFRIVIVITLRVYIYNIGHITVCPANSSIRRKRDRNVLQVNKKALPLHRVNQEFISNSLTQIGY